MSPNIRKILFTSFVVLFLFFSSSIVAFSLGWRYDFETLSFEQVGAVYVKTLPKEVQIKLNGQPYPDRSSILQSGTLISNLLPKKYNLAIEKTGYLNYEKLIAIRPEMVEEVLSAILIPETIIPEKIFPIKGDLVVAQSQDADNLIIKNSQNGNYYLYSLPNSSSTLNLTASFKESQRGSIKNIAFAPFDPDQFVIDDGKSLRLFSPGKSSAEIIVKDSPVAWSLNGANLSYIRPIFLEGSATTKKIESYGIFSYSFVFKNETLVAKIPENIAGADIKEIKYSANNIFALLSKGGELHLYKKDAFIFKKLSANVSAFDISPDGKMLAYSAILPSPFQGEGQGEVNRLSIFFLDEINNNIRKKAGDKIVIQPAGGNFEISKIAWHRDIFHLILTSADKILFAEIDDRIPSNIYPIFSTAARSIYNPKNNTLYLIKDGLLSKIDFSKF